ncbi:MAG: phenylalanine--tRNA ligase subunit alpha [Nanohaloarchaea archaeon]|nr:phenylalanine--tRNA ligase subunit alpha [Candidatus Nanohaloarchaea archaeon]
MKLSKQAKKVLEELKSDTSKTIQQFEEEGFDQSMVNRAVLELKDEELVEVEEEEELERSLTEEGKKVVENGSPEHRLIERLEDGPKEMSELQDLEIDVALGKARQKSWIRIDQGEAELTQEGREALGTDGLKERLNVGDFKEPDEERGLVEVQTSKIRNVRLTEKGKDTDLKDIKEDFNVEASAKTPRTGKKHFYREVIDYAKQKWIEMGFKEMEGGYVVPGFTCFDALYIAQDHPARDLQDTFFVENPEKSDLSEYGDKVDYIKNAHENGWETGSKGWGYDWSREDSEQNVLRTHTTAASARKLHELDEEDLPAKYFVIGRAFRNETVDRTHLADFDQAEGIVVGEDLNFAHLKGYLSEFFEKMGYDEFRLIPTYYPYTEMSVEVQVWDEVEEEWLGMGGAGLFRPEVVEPMIGVEATVLAWGLGIGRIGMMAAELDDLRDLYSNDTKLIEETPVWRSK